MVAIELACALLDQGADREAELLLAQAAHAARRRPGMLPEISRRLEECGHPEQAAVFHSGSSSASQDGDGPDRSAVR